MKGSVAIVARERYPWELEFSSRKDAKQAEIQFQKVGILCSREDDILFIKATKEDIQTVLETLNFAVLWLPLEEIP